MALCSACSQAKSHQLPFNVSSIVASKPLELIFSDVWGPSPTISFSGNKYYVSFVDSFSRYTWLFPICVKFDVFTVFKHFQLQVERYFNTKIISVQIDWGGEFRPLNTFFTQLGILHCRSCPHTHHQNGCVERKHRHVVETTLSLLAHSSVSHSFWDDACLTACYLINRLPSKVTQNISPFHKLFNREPDYKFLKVFGCTCYPHLRPYNCHKFQFRSLVSSLVTVAITKVTSVSISPLVGYIYLVMLFLISLPFFLLHKMLVPPLLL